MVKEEHQQSWIQAPMASYGEELLITLFLSLEWDLGLKNYRKKFSLQLYLCKYKSEGSLGEVMLAQRLEVSSSRGKSTLIFK